jgi:signal transduction histidine kinase/Tfp pilus assembly protein PilF
MITVVKHYYSIKNFKHLIFSLFVFVFIFQNSSSITATDSLLNIIKTNKKNPNYINALISLSDIYSENGKNDSALYYLEIAASIANKQNANGLLIDLYTKEGICFDQKGAYKEAANIYFNALALAEKIKDRNRQVKVLINLGILNFNLQKGKEAVNFYKKALKISEELKDTISIIRALNNIGNACMTYLNDFNTAEKNFIRVIELGEKIKYDAAVKVGYNNLTEIYLHKNELEKAEAICNRALQKTPDCAFANYNMAGIYSLKKEYGKAAIYYESAINYGYNFPELIQVALKDQGEAWKKNGNYEKALLSYQKYVTLKDSLHKTATDNHIKELEVKYETTSKENQIIKLNSKQKQHKILILSLTVVILAGGVAGFFMYRNIRSKKIIAEQAIEIKEQKILQLEKDRQIIATHAVLEGEEKERGRLARDLHDGLGGILSGVKLKLTNFKGNYIINQENVEIFDHALDLLDNSIKELRRVAHNMMPEALLKFGLKDALQDFCSSICLDKKLNIAFKFYGEPGRFENALETTVYRIGQELVNNAIKHANATEIFVQLIQESIRVHLTVTDNGCGFDTSMINNLKSAGLQNIRARVQSFNGQFDIDSKPGKGTEIAVEFTIS